MYVSERSLSFGAEPTHRISHPAAIRIENVSVSFGEKQALSGVSFDIYANEVVALMGPSGCGKTTLLRCLNRMNDDVANISIAGNIFIGGQEVLHARMDLPMFRRRFGWIAQRPNPFAKSIRDNVLYGPKIHGLVASSSEADDLVERALRAAALWGEVKDRLKRDATDLSIGQQQRLCIARAIALEPEFLLMDEPCSALDPISTALVENLIDSLRASLTVVMVTHSIEQAARVAQRIAFFHLGKVEEVGDAEQILVRPVTDRCRAFVTGRYG